MTFPKSLVYQLLVFKRSASRSILSSFKSSLLAPFAVGCALSLSALAEDGKIARVVVFPDRAEVTRSADVACAADAAVEFNRLPPSIDPASLRAACSSATVVAVELQHRPQSEAFFSRAAAGVDESLRAIELKIAEQQDTAARARQRSHAAISLRGVGDAQIAREMVLPAPDVKAWSVANERVLAAQLQASEEEQRAISASRTLERTRRELIAKRESLAAESGRQETFARVRVSCPAGHQAQVELTYVVAGASWSPAYEARAEERLDAHATESGAGPGFVSLALFGTVVQRTGENWDDAKLTLSTALSRRDTTLPDLAPLRVFAEPREPPRKVLVRRDEERTHAEAAASRGGDSLGTTAQQGLSVQFPIAASSSVSGDGTPSRLSLASARLAAQFVFRVVPSQLPFVMRAADLVNTAPFPLLAGPVDLFRKSGLMGRAELPRVAAGAPFHLSFGLDEQFKVKRIVVEELVKDTGIFSKGKRFRYDYAFELQSLSPAPTAIELLDRVPVSELDDVEVALDEKTTPGFVRSAEDGTIRWTATLKPSEKKRIELAFHVDVPASYDIGGL